jgi:hypothetical protein
VRRSLIVGLAAMLVGFVPPKLKQERRASGVMVTVTSSGQMFDLINSTDCLVWPNEEMKALGGQSGWGTWRPHDGDTGVALARTKHCFQDVNVIFVKIGTLYVPMGETGIRFDNGRLEDLPVITKP